MADKQTLSCLKVVDLKYQLDKRKLDKTGTKLCLLERLEKAMVEEGLDPDVYVFDSDLHEEENKDEIILTQEDDNIENDTISNIEDSTDGDNVKDESPSVRARNRCSRPGSGRVGEEHANGDKQESSLIVQVGEEEDLDYDIEHSNNENSAAKEVNKSMTEETVLRSPSKLSKVHQQGKKNAEDSSKSQTETSLDTCKNLWVSNISQSVKAAELKTLFSKYGRVLSAKIVMNAKNPQGCCFGFLLMDSVSDADRCIKNLDKAEFYGNRIVIDKTKTEPQASRVSSKKSGTSSGAKTLERDVPKKKITVGKTDSSNYIRVSRPSAADTYRRNGQTMYDRMKTSSSAAAILARAKQRKRVALIHNPLERRPIVERRERQPVRRQPIRNLSLARAPERENYDRLASYRRYNVPRYQYETLRAEPHEYHVRRDRDPLELRRLEEEKYRIREERIRLEQTKALLDIQVAQANAIRMQEHRIFQQRDRRQRSPQPRASTRSNFRRPEPLVALKRRRSPPKSHSLHSKIPSRYEERPRTSSSSASIRYDNDSGYPNRRDRKLDEMKFSYPKRTDPSRLHSTSQKKSDFERLKRTQPTSNSSLRDQGRNSRMVSQTDSRRSDHRQTSFSNYRTGWLGAPSAANLYSSNAASSSNSNTTYGRSTWITASEASSRRNEGNKDRSYSSRISGQPSSYR